MDRLYKAIQILGLDNDMRPKPMSDWPRDLNYEALNRQAELLDDEELDTFVSGEDGDRLRLQNLYQLSELNNFLNDAFDGDLHEFFFYYP